MRTDAHCLNSTFRNQFYDLGTAVPRTVVIDSEGIYVDYFPG